MDILAAILLFGAGVFIAGLLIGLVLFVCVLIALMFGTCS